MPAEPLRGCVRYRCTRYVGMDNDHLFAIIVDGQMVKRFSLETVRECLHREGLIPEQPQMGYQGYWNGFLDARINTPPEQRNEYTDREFAEALGTYPQQDIQNNTGSENPLVRMFAVLDRRVGKRAPEKLKETINDQPDWLRYFYE